MAVSYGDSAEKAFRHVGNNDADEKDDRVQPVVVQRQRNDKKHHSEENSKNRYQVNKLPYFSADRSHILLESGREECNATHQRVVANSHDDANGFTWNSKHNW